MVPRMEIGLIVASIGIGSGMAGDLANEILSLAVFVSIFTGFIPMIFLKPLMKKYIP